MATAHIHLLKHLYHLARADGTEALTDGELVQRFAACGEEASFAALVRRHGPLVLQVCQRLLEDTHTAEDVFQAAFLVLARKAGTLRKPETVGSFLYGVAYRLAQRARADAARRRRHESRQAATPPADLLAEVSGRELLAVLEGELDRLPAKYRTPLALCCLHGRTRDEAARQLGWSLRTLERRLQRGRSLLHARLMRRGLGLSALFLGALVTRPASALPAGLLGPTVRAALAFHAAPSVQAAGRAALLAQGLLRTMLLGRLKTAASLAVTLTLLAAGAFSVAPPISAARTREAQPAAQSQPKPAAPPARPAAVEDNLVLQTEDGVAAGLQWLARQQRDGHWRLDGTHRNDIAATAFALLPLLAAGEKPGRTDILHPYGRAVERGLKFLLRQQKDDGAFAGDMYAHALATRTVCLAYERTSDPALKAPAQRALDYIVKAQHEGGGWRYSPGQPGDTSVTSYQVSALAAGRRAGLTVPDETLTRAGKFLDQVATPDRSGYSYVPNSQPSFNMSAAGQLCRLELGAKADNKGLVAWADSLRQEALLKKEKLDLYYLHYATRAMRGRGGDDWKRWEEIVRQIVLQRQEQDVRTSEAGSWPPDEGGVGKACGRLMATSLALMTLQLCAEDDKPPESPARELAARELAALYASLGNDRFITAHHAVRTMAGSPRSSVPFLQAELRPAVPLDGRRIERLIADLDNDKFAVREKATAELEKLGERVQPTLRKALANNPTLETRRRIEQLLEATGPDNRNPAQRRVLFAVEVLVQARSPEARRLLETLAAGAPDAPLTHAAKSGLERLDKAKK
jgi:RNA polymerase sigma factor (sigma-70 family)